MERYDLPTINAPSIGGSASRLIPASASVPHIAAAISQYNCSLRSMRSPIGGQVDREKLSPRGDRRAERLSRLSLHEFCERIALLVELELPCAVYIANASAEQVSRGVVRKIERDMDRLNLLGDGFSLHLHQNNIDAIWLVDGAAADEGMSIEIHNRTGSLIARVFGIDDGIGAAVWQDVMGNPTFAVA